MVYDSALILGLAASGAAAARLLLAEGTKVLAVDENQSAEIRQRAAALAGLGAEVRVDGREIPARSFDVCIVSPGIKPDSAVLREVIRRQIPLLPEFELGWSRAKCPALAVTGSNGKSTLVKLCAEALQQAGLKALPAGNYGPPVSQLALSPPRADWLVIEVSSFQLEHVVAFHPQVAVLLNIFPNHLDRHRSLSNYAAIKTKLFRQMTAADSAIVQEDRAAEISRFMNGKAAVVSFGLAENADYYFREGMVYVRATGRKLSLAGTLFDNLVLGQTAAAAVAAIEGCGVSLAGLEAAARNFQPLPHRMETIGTLKGIKFIDDSKSTNAAALAAALRMTPAKIRLIAGGLPKRESYAALCPLLAEKVSGVYLIGKAAEEMQAQWRKAAPCLVCGTLEKALPAAWRQAAAGETILLSPACASFDQFPNFEARGRRFRELFAGLAAG